MKLFEVKKDGKTFYYTEHEECIPEKDDLKYMKKAGYKVYYKGKVWKG